MTVRGHLLRGMVLGDGALTPGTVVIEEGRIRAILPPDADGGNRFPVSTAATIAPGFIDLQVNGGFGVEVGEEPEAIRTLAARLPATGVTAFLPTVITSPPAF